MKFKYRATVIIPIYNRGHMVKVAFDSLLKQNMRFENIQVLIVNDGSTDDSFNICRKLAKPYTNVFVIDKPNGGVSSARNCGLKHAEGKYIFFLDDDDMLSPETIRNVCNFYDTCYDEVDLVTYPIANLYNDVIKKSRHFRYRYLNQSGVYDLNDVPAAVQTTINVCIRNKFADNVMFDESLAYMEDQAFNNKVLSQKLKIGFCTEGQYIYNHHENSAVTLSSNPIKSFEAFISYFEQLFSKYETVPKYYQCCLLHNLTYRMKDNILFPYHYSEEDYARAMDRISGLMAKIDEVTLFKEFPVDAFYKVYFHTFKKNKKAVVEFTPEAQNLSVDGEVLLSRENVMFVSNRFYFNGHKSRFIGYIRTPFFMFADKPKLFINYKGGKREEIELKESSYSYYYCDHKCAKNWMFDFTVDCDKTTDFWFSSEVNGNNYPCKCEFNTKFVARSSRPGFIALKNNTRIQLYKDVFKVRKMSSTEYKFRDLKRMLHLAVASPKIGFAFLRVKMLKKNRIWLYNDNLYTVKDNGYYQFKHDFGKNDGIERYFILDGDPARMEGLFTEEELKYVIPFGSPKHELLYLASEKIITAFCEYSAFCPLTRKKERLFFDLINSEVIYLQHGILHATTPTKYSRDRVMVDKIVVSSGFEIENFTKNYGYPESDLIPSGMPRYDYTDITKEPQNKILYAPSWRDKLIGKYIQRERKLYDHILTNSNYYKGIVAFLTNQKLLEALEKNDVVLEFKPHPNFRGYAHLFDDFLSERIRLAEPNVQLEDYKLFITDFSSFNFDFLYHGRQLLYFVPDLDEFKCGAVTFYRGLDIPFEEAFGDYAFDAETAAELAVKRIECGFKTDEKYKKKIDEFFISKGDHCEKLYKYLIENER